MKSKWPKLFIKTSILFGLLWQRAVAPPERFEALVTILGVLVLGYVLGYLVWLSWKAISRWLNDRNYTFSTFQLSWVSATHRERGMTCKVYFFYKQSYILGSKVPKRVQNVARKEVKRRVLGVVTEYNLEVVTVVLDLSSQTTRQKPVRVKAYLNKPPETQ